MTLCWNWARAQQTNDLPTLLRHAAMARRPMRTFCEELAGELGLSPHTQVVQAPLKDVERIRKKAEDKYEGKMVGICDINRNRLFFNSIDQVFSLRKLVVPARKSSSFLENLEERGLTLVEYEDCFLQPKSSGYVGINFSVKVDLGKGRSHICEVQVMHEEMKDVDKASHVIFERLREITDRAESGGRELTAEELQSRGHLLAANRQLYQGAIERLHLEPLMCRGWRSLYQETPSSAYAKPASPHP